MSRCGTSGHVDVEQPRCADGCCGDGAEIRSTTTLAAVSKWRPILLVSDTAIDGMPEQIALGRGGDGARVDRVVAHVGAVIDARDHHVRQLVEQAGHREMHAVGRRAVDEQETVGRAAHGQRPIERQRVGRAAAVALGRDDGDLGVRSELSGEAFQTGREVAVVVAEQDAHRVGWRIRAGRFRHRHAAAIICEGCAESRERSKPLAETDRLAARGRRRHCDCVRARAALRRTAFAFASGIGFVLALFCRPVARKHGSHLRMRFDLEQCRVKRCGDARPRCAREPDHLVTTAA